MSGTLLHGQSQLVTREELMAIAPPPSTATWRPIAHGDLISALDRQLLVRGIRIQKEAFAIQREGARLFAVLDLTLESSGEFSAAMGIRTANDRSMALEVVAGARVTVCDNLAFSGDLIAFRRKHTVKFDLNADLSRAVDRYQEHLLALQRRIAAAQEEVLTDEAAAVLIFEAFRADLLPLRYFKPVADTFFHPTPDMTDVQPRTLWGLHNAFTRAVRQMAPAPAFETTTALGKFFGLRTQ